jgi:hypothetical protein
VASQRDTWLSIIRRCTRDDTPGEFPLRFPVGIIGAGGMTRTYDLRIMSNPNDVESKED